MYTFSLKPELTDTQLQNITERFHFEKQDYPVLKSLYQELLSQVDAKCFFHIYIEGDLPDIPYQRYAVVLVTLSRQADDYINSKTDAGSISEAYMADCLALELLAQSYALTADRIHEVTGLWANACQFPGNEYPMSMTAALLKCFSDLPVRTTKAGVMVPAKSVVYITPLTVKKPLSDCTHVCKGCRNLSCANRSDTLPLSYNP